VVFAISLFRKVWKGAILAPFSFLVPVSLGRLLEAGDCRPAAHAAQATVDAGARGLREYEICLDRDRSRQIGITRLCNINYYMSHL